MDWHSRDGHYTKRLERCRRNSIRGDLPFRSSSLACFRNGKSPRGFEVRAKVKIDRSRKISTGSKIMKQITVAISALAISAVALLAGTTGAAAQVCRDDPPGAAFQTRGLLEMQGLDPNRYAYRCGWAYGGYRHVVPGPRYRYRDYRYRRRW